MFTKFNTRLIASAAVICFGLIFSSTIFAQEKGNESSLEQKSEKEIPEEFKKLMESAKTADESKSENHQQSELVQEVKKIEALNPPNTVPLPSNAQDANSSVNPSYKWNNREQLFIISTFGLLLIVNFIIYCVIVRGRFLFIATPFDIGARGKKNDLEKSVKWKKYFIELFLLFVVFLLIIPTINEGKSIADEDTNSAIRFGIKMYFGLHLAYIVVRGIWGSSSRCPKCGTSFAAGQTSTWDEVRVTYQKPLSNKSITMEKGVRHSEYACSACGHEWKKQAQYEKQLTY